MKTLLNQEALDFLKLHEVQVLDYSEISSINDLYSHRTPFVLKVSSKKIHNKSDKNLVKFVQNHAEAEQHWHNIRKHGTVIKQRHSLGHELLIQVVRGSSSKPSIIVGMSGVSVDFHRDFVERKCPVTENSAKKMLKDLGVYDHISSYTGKPTKIDYLARTIIQLSEIAVKESNLVALEVNPFILNNRSGKVADAKIVLEDNE
jgi:hypothetical protein